MPPATFMDRECNEPIHFPSRPTLPNQHQTCQIRRMAIPLLHRLRPPMIDFTIQGTLISYITDVPRHTPPPLPTVPINTLDGKDPTHVSTDIMPETILLISTAVLKGIMRPLRGLRTVNTIIPPLMLDIHIQMGIIALLVMLRVRRTRFKVLIGVMGVWIRMVRAITRSNALRFCLELKSGSVCALVGFVK
jgi:hypothetical protein